MRLRGRYWARQTMTDDRKPRYKLAVFDTEGTSVINDGDVFAVLYSWDLQVLDVEPEDVTKANVHSCATRYEGRDCMSLYERLNDMLEDDAYYKIAVHNLSYDYLYMRYWLLDIQDDYDVDVTAKTSTRILTVRVSQGRYPKIIFFDTLSLFGYSLRTLGDNLGYRKGDIDYTVMNAPDTVLTDNNVYYNHRDTDILLVGLCTSMLRRDNVTVGNIGTKVLTKTGIVRIQDKLSPRIGMLPTSTKKGRTIYSEDRYEVSKRQFASESDYMKWESYSATVRTPVKGCFAGGVNISNCEYIGVVLNDVISYDLKSAYPAQIITYDVPINPVDVVNVDAYRHLLKRKLPTPMDVAKCRLQPWRGTVKLENVHIAPEWLHHVSDVSITDAMVMQHMKENENVTYKDGRFYSADVLYLTLAFPTWYEVCAQLEFDNPTFIELTLYMGKSKPTRYMLLRTLHHYREKSVVKDLSRGHGDIDAALKDGYISLDEHASLKTGRMNREWLSDFVLRHKGNLNALYGILVTSPLHDEYMLDECGLVDVKKATFDTETKYDSMMWREAGVMVALYNRYKLIYTCAMLASRGADIVYCDTDSIKVKGVDKAGIDAILASMHATIERENVKRVTDLVDGLNDRAGELGYAPFDATIDASIRDLGKFDYEGAYSRFVTYGHKKYAYSDGDTWRYKASGYRTSILESFSRQLEKSGLSEIAPHIVLGYDNRYDSTTGIASIQVGIDSPWVQVDFIAADTSDGKGRHRYRGETCPGNAILPSGKVMNNTENSRLNLQRKARCIENNPDTLHCFGVDIAKDSDTFVYGPRGTVYMEWKNFNMGDDA